MFLVDDHTADKNIENSEKHGLWKIQVAYQENMAYQTARFLHHNFYVCIKWNGRYTLKSVVNEQKFTEFYNKLL